MQKRTETNPTIYSALTFLFDRQRELIRRNPDQYKGCRPNRLSPKLYRSSVEKAPILPSDLTAIVNQAKITNPNNTHQFLMGVLGSVRNEIVLGTDMCVRAYVRKALS